MTTKRPDPAWPDPNSMGQTRLVLMHNLIRFIAAIAMAENMVLLTNNTKEFERIEDLKLENWVQ